MKSFTAIAHAIFAASSALAHAGHDIIDQMPLDYVKYPYQAVAPGFTEGCQPPLTCFNEDANIELV